MTERKRSVLAILVLWATGCTALAASAGQDGSLLRPSGGVRQLLADAEAAYDRGDVVAAEHAYAAVLEADSEQPRALFRLAQLRQRDPAAAAALLQRYVALVPSDAWGYLALAHAYARGGHAARALQACDEALVLEPQDADIQLGRPRVLARLGRVDAAIDAFEAWLADHPADREVWRELATLRERAGRVRGAARALQRAQALSPDDTDIAKRLDRLRVRSAPAVQVGGAAAGETDVFTAAPSFGAEIAAGDTARLGMSYQERRVESFGDVARTRRVLVEARARPRSDVQVSVRGGAAWMPSAAALNLSRLRPEAAFRLRRSSAAGGPIVDVKAQHDSIEATPDLVRAPVSRTQILGALDAPLAGWVRARGQVRAATLARGGEHNRRIGTMGGIALGEPGVLRVSGQWHQIRHTNPLATGYFAPALAQVADVGLEFEREYDRGSIALDAGGGVQRFRRAREAPLGAWAPALRLWGLATWNIGAGQQLLAEFESYDSHASDAVVASHRWRYASVTASLRVVLR